MARASEFLDPISTMEIRQEVVSMKRLVPNPAPDPEWNPAPSDAHQAAIRILSRRARDDAWDTYPHLKDSEREEADQGKPLRPALPDGKIPDLLAYKVGWCRIVEIEDSVRRSQLAGFATFARTRRAILVVAYVERDYSVRVEKHDLGPRPGSGQWRSKVIPKPRMSSRSRGKPKALTKGPLAPVARHR